MLSLAHNLTMSLKPTTFWGFANFTFRKLITISPGDFCARHQSSAFVEAGKCVQRAAVVLVLLVILHWSLCDCALPGAWWSDMQSRYFWFFMFLFVCLFNTQLIAMLSYVLMAVLFHFKY